MIILFCATLHAAFQTFAMNSFALASTLLGVFNPCSSNEAMEFLMLNEFLRRALITFLDTSSSPDLVQAFVGNAVVPVQIITAFAF